jgi:hypothetical protein
MGRGLLLLLLLLLLQLSQSAPPAVHGRESASCRG